MRKPAAKLFIRIPRDLAAELRRCVGVRGLSGFVTRAIAQELEWQDVGAIPSEMEGELGPVQEAKRARVRRQLPKR